MGTAKIFSAFLFTALLLSACGSFDADGLPTKPGSAAKQPDPNCDRFAFGGGGDSCRPREGMPKDKSGRRLPL